MRLNSLRFTGQPSGQSGTSPNAPGAQVWKLLMHLSWYVAALPQVTFPNLPCNRWGHVAPF